MLIINEYDGSRISTYIRMMDDEKLPIEFLAEGNFEQSLKAYQELMEKDKEDPTIDENNLNRLGYRFLNNEQTKLAQDIFKVNVILYSNSSNVYDSYAEACMENGAYELAIENYKKSLNLDPQNNNAKEQIKKLEKNKQNKL